MKNNCFGRPMAATYDSQAAEVTRALGGRYNGRTGTACCPAHHDRSPSLSICNGSDGKLLLHCHAGCSYWEVAAALQARGIIPSTGAVRACEPNGLALLRASDDAEAVKRALQAARCWEEALPIEGTVAEDYLRSRHITCALPQTLRFHPDCWHQSGVYLPAMVARVEGVQRFAIHRTYLLPDGSGKAQVKPSKAMRGSVSGGAVRLSEAADLLIVAEGIETALSLGSGLISRPASIWAALSANGMKSLFLPATPGRLIVAPDGDAVGRNAAKNLATRAVTDGWSVSMMAAPDGLDWNDTLAMEEVVNG